VEAGATKGMPLILRRANVSRTRGPWPHDDFDVFDGDRDVGRVYQQAPMACRFS
jgi:hypothetical protein